MTVTYCPYGGGLCEAAGIDWCEHKFDNLIQCQEYATKFVAKLMKNKKPELKIGQEVRVNGARLITELGKIVGRHEADMYFVHFKKEGTTVCIPQEDLEEVKS